MQFGFTRAAKIAAVFLVVMLYRMASQFEAQFYAVKHGVFVDWLNDRITDESFLEQVYMETDLINLEHKMQAMLGSG